MQVNIEVSESTFIQFNKLDKREYFSKMKSLNQKKNSKKDEIFIIRSTTRIRLLPRKSGRAFPTYLALRINSFYSKNNVIRTMWMYITFTRGRDENKKGHIAWVPRYISFVAFCSLVNAPESIRCVITMD